MTLSAAFMRNADRARPVPYVNFPVQFEEERREVLAIVTEVFERGDFVDGAAIVRLEQALCDYVGVRHIVALNSGTDALILGIKAMGIGPGDEVITPPNSFVASTAAIVSAGAKPVFADVLPDQNVDPEAVAAAITPRTRAIMPVHLTGRMCDMTPLMKLAESHGLLVIEDAAQSIGSRYGGRMSGSFGHVGAFSCHPLKNLNAAGDAGFIATNDENIATRVRFLRHHGLADRNTVVEWGTVSRMDTLQAAVLTMRLGRIMSVIERRRRNAEFYREGLAGLPVFMPPCRNVEFNTFHTFVVQMDRRDELQAFLAGRGIGSAIHYPVPIHLQPAAKSLGHTRGDFPATERQADRILSLPIHQFLTPEDVATVCAAIREFYQ